MDPFGQGQGPVFYHRHRPVVTIATGTRANTLTGTWIGLVRDGAGRVDTGIVAEPVETHSPVPTGDAVLFTFVYILTGSVVFSHAVPTWTGTLVPTSEVGAAVLTDVLRVALVNV